MNKPDLDRDPGWGPVLANYPKIIIPVLGMTTMTKQTSGLQSMRFLWVAFANVLLLIWIPVVLFHETDGAPVGVSTGIAVTAVLGVFAQLLAPRFAPLPDVSSPAALAGSFQRATFIRIAFAEAAAFVGLIMFLLTGHWLVYAVGFAIAAAGLWDAAPRTGRLDALQQQVREAGSNLKVIRSLNQTRLTR